MLISAVVLSLSNDLSPTHPTQHRRQGGDLVSLILILILIIIIISSDHPHNRLSARPVLEFMRLSLEVAGFLEEMKELSQRDAMGFTG
jgi:hypothetical protein